jgi:predicted N-acetyltransferase YhbS
MSMVLRRCDPGDAEQIGEICYKAFKTISEEHNFPPDFPSAEVAISLLSDMIRHPNIYGVVAELDGRVVGSNFVDERSVIAGIGPITVDPAVQNRAVGRELMRHIQDRVKELRFSGVRLVQAAYHNRSLSLYAKLGFVAREPLSVMQGQPLGLRIAGHAVRTAVASDLDACNQVCFRVHGHHRGGELADAIKRGTATVVERNGRITGYATSIAFFGHAVGETNDDVKALIGAAPAFLGPGFLVPARNGELFRWCLEEGLRVVEPLTLMSVGLYNDPAGAYLPSILF